MALFILRLEDRILFDAAAPAVIAQVVADAGESLNENPTQADAGAEPHTDGSPEAPALVDAVPTATEVNVLVVSSQVDNAQQLADAAKEGIIVVLYDYNTTTFDQLQQMISDTLSGRQADTIAFATEGQSGLFHLIKDVHVSASSLAENAELANFWKSVGSMMNDGGRVDLLGCFIAGAEGNNFGLLDSLENLIETANIDVDIAASTDLTGNIRDGNWMLEVGNVDAITYFNVDSLSTWLHTLATFTVTNTNDAGAGSLRQAIEDANAAAGFDTIDFDLDVSTPQIITLSSNLPTLTEDVFIDGTTATNYLFGSQMVTISRTGGATLTVGAGVSAEIQGLQITGSGGVGVSLSTGSSTIRENIISGNSIGVDISGGTHTIYGNYIGTDVTGMLDLGNTSNGISISGGTDHIIGGSGTGEGNVISGNNGSGIAISGSATATIQGNYVGLAMDGTTALGNSGTGIILTTTGSVTIGGDRTAGVGNTISSNVTGINISNGTHYIYGNYIGTDVDGMLDLGNAGNGITITGGTNHIIGGTGTGQFNVISGNNQAGIAISGSATATIRSNIIGLGEDGETALGNLGTAISLSTTGSVTVGGNRNNGEGNTISGNGAHAGIAAINITAGTQTIYGNYIGTDVDGTLDVGNAGTGIVISGGINHIIGGPGTGQLNVISGNGRRAIDVTGSATATIQGNIIGLNADGNAAIANGEGALLLTTTGSVTIGGNRDAGEGNTISGNGSHGGHVAIVVSGASAGTHTFYGNYIGTDVNGGIDLGNDGNAFSISGGINHIIGGTGTGQRNVISGQPRDGIIISGSATAIIRGNYIGLAADGVTVLANGQYGISLTTTGSVSVGGTTVEERNIISGNANGIRITAGTHVIYGNYIGTDVSGTLDRGNGTGIAISGGVNHVIGGIGSGQRNVISGNNTNQISLLGTATAIIKGNYIGTDESGQFAINAPAASNLNGINISSTATSTIGADADDILNGTTEEARNIISGNRTGILLSAGTHNVYGNYIGTDVDGVDAVGNTFAGISIAGGSDHQIGGVLSDQGNLISGNARGISITGGNALVRGNTIGLNVSGTALSNTVTGIIISSTVASTVGGTTEEARNVISGNATGITLSGGTQNVIGNYIGTDANGSVARANTTGISVTGGTVHNIGGVAPGEGNLISGNTTAGISITAGSALVRGNTIGLNASGAALTNTTGVVISSTAASTIGGSTVEARNVISGNTTGITLSGGTQNILGNYIGTDANGSVARANTTGISVTGGTVHNIGGVTPGEGNLISGNTTAGISITAGSALVRGNTIGLNASGTALTNTTGIVISSAAASTIGGSTAAARNVISGNTTGITLSSGTQSVIGNYIGTNADGSAARANTTGISVTGGTVHNIGGIVSGEGNLISGNTTAGISITAGSVLARGNTIGLNASGVALTNTTGIVISSAAASTIGGSTAAARNVISGNTTGISISNGTQSVFGNYIGTDSTGAFDLGNSGNGIDISGGTNHTIGGAGAGNVISGNNQNGIFISGSATATIKGNIIGLNADGNTALGNSQQGLSLQTTGSVTVGGDHAAGEGNTISGNGTSGVHHGIDISAGTHTIQGNYIGTDVDGAVDLGNAGNGINISGGTNHIIGGINDIIDNSDIGQGNVISGNNLSGILISGSATATIKGNIIGLNADGDTALGNSQQGISLGTTGSVTVGGDHAAGEGNTISGNGTSGVHHGIDISAGTHTIQGNYIGTDVDGAVDLGNAGNGINISGGTNHIIGGINDIIDNSDIGQGNVISGNNLSGILISGSATATIKGNIIGLNADGDTALGNSQQGISLETTGSVIIGGDRTASEGNTISGNGTTTSHHGINITAGAGTHTIYGNYIGTDVDGMLDRGNAGNGITISGGTNHIIGGAGTGQGNVISGNDGTGIGLSSNATATIKGNIIGLNADGDTALGNSQQGISLGTTGSVTVGGNRNAGEGNTISGNGTTTSHHGINILAGAGAHTIYGNYIGTDVDGTLDLGNGGNGIFVQGGTNHIIGGAGTGQSNVISSNNASGISIVGNATATIRGNIIGLNADGDTALGNSQQGISLGTTGSVTVGGDRAAGEGNTISGNGTTTSHHGINIIAGAGTHTIYGNYIGTDVDGTLDLGNAGNGIFVQGGTNHIIGGAGTGQSNVISGNNASGISIVSNATATIRGNIIGLNKDGAVALGNSQHGISLGTTGSVTIGGNRSADEGNTISGNGNHGITISSGTHTIYGNYIGTDVDGTVDLGNGGNGINITGGTNHIIGGTGTGERNIISGNGGLGISSGGASGIMIRNNYIGVDFEGTTAIANSNHGVNIQGGSNHVIGGTGTDERNIISGNGFRGLVIGGHATGTVTNNYIGLAADGTALGNSSTGLFLGAGVVTIQSNFISGNNGNGIEISTSLPGPTTYTIYGNFIGTDILGATAIANTGDGINISSGTDHIIGGTGTDQRNIISGNGGTGIEIGSGATSTITNNYIGLDANGTTALGNSQNGIQLGGGSSLVQGNVVSGNGGYGIGIVTSQVATYTIYGNYVGTDFTGAVAIGNAGNGMTISGGTNHIIGGTDAGQRNVISGNSGHGIFFNGGNGTVVRNNYIGVDSTGMAGLGNALNGIDISSGNNITIGGSATDQGNVISGNAKGIEVRGGTGLVVQGNIIGRNAANTAAITAPGSTNAIDFNGAGFRGAQVGGINAGEGNVIADSNGAGVRVNNATGVAIRGNSIFLNASLGIDLVGTGNNAQQPPTLTGITYDSGLDETTVHMSFTGTVGSTYAFDLYSNPLTDGAPFEGRTYVTTLVLTLTSATQSIAFVMGGTFPTTYFTATATNTTINVPGNTSEFSETLTIPILSLESVLTYTESQAPTVINPDVVVADPDSINLVGAVVSITGNFAFGEDVLGFTNMLGITGSYDADTGVLTLSGISSVANYQAALRSITYYNSSENPSTLVRTVSFIVNDGAQVSNSLASIINVISVNELPVQEGTNYSNVNPPTIDWITPIELTYTDKETPSDQLVYTLNTNVVGGTLLVNGVPLGVGGSFTQAQVNAGLVSYQYTNLVGMSYQDSFVFSVTDGDGGSVQGTFTFTINRSLLSAPQYDYYELLPALKEQGDKLMLLQNAQGTLFGLSSPFHEGNGFFNVEGINQLTSFGDRMGYDHLLGMGNRSISFNIVNGEPQLTHRNRGTGYGAGVDALNYVMEYQGFRRDTVEVNGMIEELSDNNYSKS
jgi:hypothetical protein